MKHRLLLFLMMLLVSAPVGLASAEDGFATGEMYDETTTRLQSPEPNVVPTPAPRRRQPATAAPGRQEPATTTAPRTPRTPRTTATTRGRSRTVPQRTVTTPRPAETSPGETISTPGGQKKGLKWNTQDSGPKPNEREVAAPATDGKPATKRPQWGKGAENSSEVQPKPKWGKTTGE